MRELLDSPLMLNIVTAAYMDQRESQPRLSGTLKERRDHLFGAYVDQMFRRRGAHRRYPPQQTVHWLTWLAWQMVQRSQTVFYIERLQPDWLPGEQRWAFGLVYRMVVGLVFGLVAGLVYGLFFGLLQVVGLVYAPWAGGRPASLQAGPANRAGFWLGRAMRRRLVFGLIYGLFGGLLCGISEEIICAETASWSWSKVSKRDLVDGLVGRLRRAGLRAVRRAGRRWSAGCSAGCSAGRGASDWSTRWSPGCSSGCSARWSALFGGLVGGLVGGLHLLLESGLSVGDIEIRDIPNQGIHRSAWNALVFGLFGGLVGGLVVGLVDGLVFGLFGGLFVGLVVGLAVGLFGALNAGGQACLEHLALRLLLVRSGSIPWNYVNFLDYAAERILLRKVGGGYIFIHRMLLEYFAARYDKSSVEATPHAEPS